MRFETLRAHVAALIEAVLEGDAATPREVRRAAFEGRVEDPDLARYVTLVREQAGRIRDDDVERLRAAGLGDDAVFELTLAAALGAAAERLRAGMAVLGREP